MSISPTGGSIGIGFSIPSNLAVNVIDQLREYGETRRGWLGIRLQALNEDIAKGLGVEQSDGAVVMGIVPGGLAAIAMAQRFRFRQVFLFYKLETKATDRRITTLLENLI